MNEQERDKLSTVDKKEKSKNRLSNVNSKGNERDSERLERVFKTLKDEGRQD